MLAKKKDFDLSWQAEELSILKSGLMRSEKYGGDKT